MMTFTLHCRPSTRAGNCETAARENQQEADTLIIEAGEKMNEAKALDERARRLEEEAAR